LGYNHHPGQLSLASPVVAKSSTSFGWGKGGKVTSTWWQVTLCDLIWHAISRSGMVISITYCYIRFTFTLLYQKSKCSSKPVACINVLTSTPEIDKLVSSAKSVTFSPGKTRDMSFTYSKDKRHYRHIDTTKMRVKTLP